MTGSKPMKKRFRSVFGLVFLVVVLPAFGGNARGGQGPVFMRSVAELGKVFLGRTFVLNTAKPVERVVVGDGRIARVRAVSTSQILVKGLRAGWTNLVIWYKGEEMPSVFDMKVEADPGQIQEVESLIKRLVPKSSVRLVPAGSELILEGTVTSQEDLQRVLQITASYFRYKHDGEEREEEQAKSSTTINISTGGYVGPYGEEGGQLLRNVELTVAVRNNLIVLKGAQQVQLEVRIAEVSRSGIKRMGLNFLNNNKWAIGISRGGGMEGSMTGSSKSSDDGAAGGTDILKTLTSEAGIASPFGAAFNILVHSLKGDTLAILSLLKGQGLAKLLASPTLVTMSGQEASFRVGGEFPIPITDRDGGTTVQYKEYGITLRFTPYVVGEETITLEVHPEVSAPDWSLGTASGGVAVPGVTSRTGYTTLQLKDGQTFVMAGLLKDESHLVVNKVPFLGDIPILGALFTSKDFQRNETELVVVVTPRLVRPLNREEVVSLPGEGLARDVTDLDFFLLNRTDMKLPEYSGKIGFAR